MNKIYLLLAICLIFLTSSCSKRVLTTEPIPSSNRTILENIPDGILGKYTISSRNHHYPLHPKGEEIFVYENENVLHIDSEHGAKFMFDFRSNIAYASGGGPVELLHGKELKIFTQDKNIYVNAPYEDGYWYFIVIKPMTGDRLKVIFSRFHEGEFEKNKYAYETNENFISCSDDKLIFDVVNADEFEKILDDGKLLTSFILKKKTQ